MKIKKIALLILFAFVLTLVGCGSSNSPQALWNRYIKAMNSKEIEKVAEIYYAKGSTQYTRFVENTDAVDYFDDYTKLVTKSFTTELSNEKYFSAIVSLNVMNGPDYENKQFNVYFQKDISDEWKFITEVNPTAYDYALLGNQPDANYYNGIIKTGEGFDYKYVYGGTPGEVSDADYIKIVAPNSNSKNVVIPSEIDGKPVKVIGDFTFFDYMRIFSVTIPTSKLETIVFPETLTTIEDYAFYQAKNLKELELPKSLETVGKYAFASSTSLKKITINVDEDAMYGEGNVVYKTGKDSLAINGSSVLFVGQKQKFTVNGALVDWSSSDETVATIDTSGNVTAIAVGTTTITAVNKIDNTKTAVGQLTVMPSDQKEIISSPVPMSGYQFKVNRNIYVGDSFSIKFNPPFASTWSTSNPSVATIDSKGNFKAVGEGQVTIKSTVDSNQSFYTSVTLNIQSADKKNIPYTLSYQDKAITFTGAKDLYVSDYVKLQTEGFGLGDLIWTSNNPAVASVSMYDGELTALSKGNVTITATRKDDPNIYSSVTLTVSDVTPALTFSENSLDRLYGLKEIYLNAINPNSVVFKGTLKLPSDVKIYVPAQNFETYKKTWTNYKDNIYVMPN